MLNHEPNALGGSLFRCSKFVAPSPQPSPGWRSGADGPTAGPHAAFAWARAALWQASRLRFDIHRDSLLLDAAPGGGGPVGEADGARISGFRLFGPSFGNQSTDEVGIRIIRCIDAEISNMEIAGWAEQGVKVLDDQAPEPAGRILFPEQVRIHDNYIHHNQHPAEGFFSGHAGGYGVETDHGAWAQFTHNLFDYNRHSIAAASDTGGYDAEENLARSTVPTMPRL